MVRLCIVFLLVALGRVVLAGPLQAPQLREGHFVYRIPSDFIPDKLSVRGLQEIDNAAGKLHHPFYVVFVKNLPTQSGDSTDQDAERSLVGLAEDWSRDQAFDRNRATIFLVSYGPGDRKFRMLPAPRWRSQLQLEYTALEPFTLIFRKTARTDPQTAITNMMKAFDTHVFDRTDPQRIAQRAEEQRKRQEQVRIDTIRANASTAKIEMESLLQSDRALLPADTTVYRTALQRVKSVERGSDFHELEVAGAALMDAARRLRTEVEQKQQARVRLANVRAETGIAATEMETLLQSDPTLLPADTSAYRSALQNVRSAQQGGDVRDLEAAGTALADSLRQLHSEVDARQRQQNAEAMTKIGFGLGVLALLLISVLLGVARRASIAKDRTKLATRLAEWRAWIQQARQRYYIFDETRDRAPHLKAFGGKTGQVYEATSKEIDSIITGVEAIAERLDKIEKQAAGTSFLNRGPLSAALAGLEQPFDFNTEQISGKLFEPERKTIQVTPRAFFETLSSRYDAAIHDWQALNDSVTESLQLPDALFPHTGLDAMFAKAAEHRIPERWLAKHPLIGTPDQDQTLYARVNECRLTDPYAYALQIHDLREQEQKISNDLDLLIATVNFASSNKVEAVTGLESTVLHPEDNPQITLDAANLELSRIPGLLSTATATEDVVAQAKRSHDLFEKCAAQIAAAQAAIVSAEQTVSNATNEMRTVGEMSARVAGRLEDVSREHSNVLGVKSAYQAAMQFQEAANRDFIRAQEKLSEHRHLEALRDAQQALSLFGQASGKMEVAMDICSELDAAKARYMQQLAEMESAREDAMRRIRRYGGSSYMLDEFRPPSTHGLVDYAYMIGMLQQTQQHWNMVARQAQQAYEAAERARREAEEASRRARQAALYSSSSSSSSSWTSSSGSGSSGGSFSSGGGSGSSGGSW